MDNSVCETALTKPDLVIFGAVCSLSWLAVTKSSKSGAAGEKAFEGTNMVGGPRLISNS